MSAWYFHYQKQSKESAWTMTLADQRQAVLESKPAFVTVLDLSAVPEDNDWSKVRYRGPLYFDFDADGDLDLVIGQTMAFMGKLVDEFEFDLSQCRMWASGGKGFHIEIPMECFIPRVSPQGYAWLPAIYKEMAQKVIVDTLDLSVYSGKKGRMWRTPGVQRESGAYKVPLLVDELMGMTPEMYVELCSKPRAPIEASVPVCNSKLALLFDQSKVKVTDMLKNKKRKSAAANEKLAPWKKAGQHMPSILSVMNGDNLRSDVGFQRIAMQLAIYAVSMGLGEDDFVIMCQGLCANHSSDSYRYNSPEKRSMELRRMWEYMSNDSLYDFDPAPILSMLTPGTIAPDLGIADTGTDAVGEAAVEIKQGSSAEEIQQAIDHKQLANIRRGFYMNNTGMFRQQGEKTETICRAYLTDIQKVTSINTDDSTQTREFVGFNFTLNVPNVGSVSSTLSQEALTSLAAVKRYFATHAVSFQGLDADVNALFDIMATNSQSEVSTLPREGIQVIDNPVTLPKRKPVVVYATRTGFVLSRRVPDEEKFELKYGARGALSAYNIDIHTAPRMKAEYGDVYDNLFTFNKVTAVADLLGWFTACHFRSVYQRFFRQFPLLQAYGESGAGKTATVMALSKLHWYVQTPPLNSAMGLTPFALETIASTSTSAPMVLDEYKPRELAKAGANKLPKIRDLLKASYSGGQIANKGTLNKSEGGGATVIRMDATAPIVFMTEGLEGETAILERCVPVNFSKNAHTADREAAINVLKYDEEALSALGREIVEYALFMDLNEFKADMIDEIKLQESQVAAFGAATKRDAPRIIFNRAVINHSLKILERILKSVFGMRYNEQFERLLDDSLRTEERKSLQSHTKSEIGKVVDRLQQLSFEDDLSYCLRMGIDFAVYNGFMELKVETSYDRYRMWCVRMHDVPLFDNVEAFRIALSNFSPIMENNVLKSKLRDDGSMATIVKLDLNRLRKEGINSFKL